MLWTWMADSALSLLAAASCDPSVATSFSSLPILQGDFCDGKEPLDVSARLLLQLAVLRDDHGLGVARLVANGLEILAGLEETVAHVSSGLLGHLEEVLGVLELNLL